MGVMVTDKVVVDGTNKDLRLMARDGVALSLATKDNVDRIMTGLQESQKKVTQLKETLKKERNENQNSKRNYEDMISEMEVSKADCQTLQSDKYALVLSASNIEKESQATLADFGKLQQRPHVLEAERDNLKLLIEELNQEKRQLEDKVAKLERQKNTAKGKAKLYETQVATLENQKNFTGSLIEDSDGAESRY